MRRTTTKSNLTSKSKKNKNKHKNKNKKLHRSSSKKKKKADTLLPLTSQERKEMESSSTSSFSQSTIDTNEIDDTEIEIPKLVLPPQSQFMSKISPLKSFKIGTKTYQQDIETLFDKFETLLRQRKQACLELDSNNILMYSKNGDNSNNGQTSQTATANGVTSGSDSNGNINPASPAVRESFMANKFVYIDINKITEMIYHIGTNYTSNMYYLGLLKTDCINDLREINTYELTITQYKKEISKFRSKIKNELAPTIEDINKQMGNVSFYLDTSRIYLNKIDGSKLSEIRAMKHPHLLLVKLVKACAIMVRIIDFETLEAQKAAKHKSKRNANKSLANAMEETWNWVELRKLLKMETFIDVLMGFEASDDSLTRHIRDVIEKEYLCIDDEYASKNDIDIDVERITYAGISKVNANVGGNLFKWLEAQLKYHNLQRHLEGYKKRLKECQIEYRKCELMINNYKNGIKELEKRIVNLRNELELNVFPQIDELEHEIAKSVKLRKEFEKQEFEREEKEKENKKENTKEKQDDNES